MYKHLMGRQKHLDYEGWHAMCPCLINEDCDRLWIGSRNGSELARWWMANAERLRCCHY